MASDIGSSSSGCIGDYPGPGMETAKRVGGLNYRNMRKRLAPQFGSSSASAK